MLDKWKRSYTGEQSKQRKITKHLFLLCQHKTTHDPSYKVTKLVSNLKIKSKSVLSMLPYQVVKPLISHIRTSIN